MSSLQITQRNLVPVRRDGQIVGGDYGSGGGGGTVGSGSGNVANLAETLARESADQSLSTSLSAEVSSSVHVESKPLATSIGVFTDENINIITGTTGLTYNGHELITDGDIVSPVFLSGFAGEGMKIDKGDDGQYTITCDNLIIRRLLKVFELQISKISAVNGGILVSIANGTTIGTSGTTTPTFYFDTNSNRNPLKFVPGDWVRAQQWDNGLNYFQGQVDTTGTTYITIKAGYTGQFWEKMDLVQVGHPTIASRQSIIFITVDDGVAGGPIIDFLSGVTDGNFSGHNICRIGSLEGISDVAFGGALHGAGLYGSNVFLKGRVQIASSDVSGLGSLASKNSVDLNSSEVTNKSLANLDSAANTKLGGIAVGATKGATWGTNLYSMPDGASTLVTGTPPSSGLYMNGDALGYYSSGWKSYIDNQGNFAFGNYASGGNGITWTQSNGALVIRGAVVITNSIPSTSVSGLGTLATQNTVANTQVTGLGTLATANSVAYGDVTGTKPPASANYDSLLAPGSSPGLYLNSTMMGYWNGSSFVNYMDNQGNCSFTGIGTFSAKPVTEGSSGLMGISISGDDIYESESSTGAGTIFINRKGYQGGNTVGRQLIVGDGLGNPIASFYNNGYYPHTRIWGNMDFAYADSHCYFQPPVVTTAQLAYNSAPNGSIVFVSNYGSGQFAGRINGSWYYFTMHT